jgi:hypothetical protein
MYKDKSKDIVIEERTTGIMKRNHCIELLRQQEGSVLLLALVVMAALSIVGITSLNISSTEQLITGNVQRHKMAFYDADAGVQYTLARLENDLKNGTLNGLPAEDFTVDYENSEFIENNEFNFSISDIQFSDKDPDPDQYWFTSTGNAPQNAQVIIKATFIEKVINPFTFAAFGDKKMEVKNSAIIESYDSDSTDPKNSDPSHTNFKSTGEADIGSNENLITKNYAQVDGNGVVGKDSGGIQGEYDIKSGSVFTGTAPNLQDRVDPDPLGVTSGGKYDPTTYSSSANNDNNDIDYGYITNGSDKTAIGTEITTNNGDTVTLIGKPGGSNFYFTSVELKNNVDLVVDTTLGPVNIFLDDASGSGGTIFNAKNGSAINQNGETTDFAIYSNSNSSNNDILMHNGSAFTGIIYAPYAEIDLRNSSAIYGAIWGSEIIFHNSVNLFFDEALTGKYELTNTNELSLVSWEIQ